MLKVLAARLHQGPRTMAYPDGEPVLPDRFRGLPALEPAKCTAGCAACRDGCPVGAVEVAPGAVRLDLGRCLFCGECESACPAGAIRFTRAHALAARDRAALVCDGRAAPLRAALDERLRALFGRSLQLREVSAGGCNACEADCNVLTTVGFDLSRFGIQFVASPRHADGLLITGPVTKNMELALRKTYEAVAAPKIVIAVGACAIAGGPYLGHEEVCGGAASVVPVDLYVPGCPPHPITILDGLLRLLGRLEERV
jgi:Ni,Fe-hydrogenase III small subunit/NAD-dependent dihydropyrimidine dehydrogenase PreA subunit